LRSSERRAALWSARPCPADTEPSAFRAQRIPCPAHTVPSAYRAQRIPSPARTEPSAYRAQRIPCPAHTEPSAYRAQRVPSPAHTEPSAYRAQRIPSPAHTEPSAYRAQRIPSPAHTVPSAYRAPNPEPQAPSPGATSLRPVPPRHPRRPRLHPLRRVSSHPRSPLSQAAAADSGGAKGGVRGARARAEQPAAAPRSATRGAGRLRSGRRPSGRVMRRTASARAEQAACRAVAPWRRVVRATRRRPVRDARTRRRPTARPLAVPRPPRAAARRRDPLGGSPVRHPRWRSLRCVSCRPCCGVDQRGSGARFVHRGMFVEAERCGTIGGARNARPCSVVEGEMADDS